MYFVKVIVVMFGLKTGLADWVVLCGRCCCTRWSSIRQWMTLGRVARTSTYIHTTTYLLRALLYTNTCRSCQEIILISTLATAAYQRAQRGSARGKNCKEVEALMSSERICAASRHEEG